MVLDPPDRSVRSEMTCVRPTGARRLINQVLSARGLSKKSKLASRPYLWALVENGDFAVAVSVFLLEHLLPSRLDIDQELSLTLHICPQKNTPS